MSRPSRLISPRLSGTVVFNILVGHFSLDIVEQFMLNEDDGSISGIADLSMPLGIFRLKRVTARTPLPDAKGMLKSAIPRSSPRHLHLSMKLYNVKGEVPDEDVEYTVPLNRGPISSEKTATLLS